MCQRPAASVVFTLPRGAFCVASSICRRGTQGRIISRAVMPVSPGQLVLSRRSSSQISSPAASTPLSRASSPATVFSASLPSRRSPAPSSTSPGGSQIQQLLRPAAPTLSHDAQLVANRELEKAQAQLEGILSEQRAMSEQSKKWSLSESPKSFSQQVQASAARLSQLDIEHAETEALLQHRATLAVYTERSLAAQASTSSAQKEFERARQAAREVRRGADPCPHTHIFLMQPPTSRRDACGRRLRSRPRHLRLGRGPRRRRRQSRVRWCRPRPSGRVGLRRRRAALHLRRRRCPSA